MKVLSRREKMAIWWEAHFLSLHLAIGAVFGMSVAIAVESSDTELATKYFKQFRSALYAALVSAFGALFGFVITSMSIIATWVKKKAFIELRKQKTYPQLWDIYRSAVRWLGGTTTMAVVALLWDTDEYPCRTMWYIIAAMCSITFLRLYRCVWVLELLIGIIAAPIPPDPEVAPQPKEIEASERVPISAEEIQARYELDNPPDEKPEPEPKVAAKKAKKKKSEE